MFKRLATGVIEPENYAFQFATRGHCIKGAYKLDIFEHIKILLCFTVTPGGIVYMLLQNVNVFKDIYFIFLLCSALLKHTKMCAGLLACYPHSTPRTNKLLSG